MLLVDILLALAVLGSVGAGIKDGLVHTIGRLVGAVIGFVIARSWSLGLSGIFSIFLPVGTARLVAFVLIFLVVTRLVGFGFKLVDGVFKILSVIPFLKSINSILGAIAGLAEGIILIGGIIFVIKTYFLEPHLVAWVTSSVVAQWIEKIFKVLLGVLL